MLLNKKLDKRLVGLLAGVVCYGLSASVAQAVMINEDGDAGEELATAQDTTGTGASLESIAGTLINLGTNQDPIDDIDMFLINITNPGAFSVMVTATLSIDNDATLWLFDTAGAVVIADDDSGAGLLPQFNVGDLTDPPNGAGMYFLAFNLFETNPDNVAVAPPNLDDGWFRDPIPFQTGPYTLSLTGVSTAVPPPSIPEPGMLALFGLGLVGMGFVRRRTKI